MKDSIIEKILLHIYESIDYGSSYRFKKGLYIDDLFYSSNWNKFSKKEIQKSFDKLEKSNFIIRKGKNDGSVAISLSDKGKLRALNYKFRRLAGKKEKWDGKWRMVCFNVPENHRKGRDAIRYRLRSTGFYELQESIFIFPYECEREIRDFIKLFKMEKYIRFIVADYIDDGQRIASLFKLK